MLVDGPQTHQALRADRARAAIRQGYVSEHPCGHNYDVAQGHVDSNRLDRAAILGRVDGGVLSEVSDPLVSFLIAVCMPMNREFEQ